MIDDKVITPGWSLYDYLRSKEITPVIANKVVTHFQPIASELVEAIDTKDKDLLEGYRTYSRH